MLLQHSEGNAASTWGPDASDTPSSLLRALQEKCGLNGAVSPTSSSAVAMTQGTHTRFTHNVYMPAVQDYSPLVAVHSACAEVVVVHTGHLMFSSACFTSIATGKPWKLGLVSRDMMGFSHMSI